MGEVSSDLSLKDQVREARCKSGGKAFEAGGTA